jgi:hypothetical protein
MSDVKIFSPTKNLLWHNAISLALWDAISQSPRELVIFFAGRTL